MNNIKMNEIEEQIEKDILENTNKLKKIELPTPLEGMNSDDYFEYLNSSEEFKPIIEEVNNLINRIVNDEENRHQIYSDFDDDYNPNEKDDRFYNFVMSRFRLFGKPESQTVEPALYGYVRVSTSKQDTKAQEDALQAHGVPSSNIFSDTISGKTSDRPGLNELMEKLTRGDILCIWKLDRLGRSVSHICEIIQIFQDRGVVIRSLSDGLTYDPSSLMGRALIQQMAIFAELERGLIQERAKLGMDYAKKHGTKSGKAIGRPTVSSAKLGHAMDLIAGGDSLTQVARKTGISRTRLFMETKRHKEEGNLQRQATIFHAIGSTKKRKG